MRERGRVRALEDQRRNPKKRRAQRDAWIERNPELNREIKRAWARAHPEYVRENHRRRDFEKNKAYTRGYRARKKGNGGTHTPADLDRLLMEQAGRCVYCLTELRRYEVDHRTPLARGGSNGPENLQLLCALCNRSKGARTHEEHMSKNADQLKAESDAAVAANRAALLKHREDAGHVTVKCSGCGTESVFDAKRPDDAPPGKCGNCGTVLAAAGPAYKAPAPAKS